MLGYLVPRSVTFDLIKTTILALVGVSALLTMGGAMLEATRQGLNPLNVMLLMPYLVPPTFPYTLPTCLLFACTVVYGRMAGNLEITALKASGVHTFRILLPAITLSFVASGISVYMADQFIPACNRRVAEIILSDMQSNLYAYLKQFGSLPYDPEFPYEIYVNDVRGERLINPIFKHRNSRGEYDMVATSSEATLTVKMPPGTNDLSKATVVVHLIDGVSRIKGNHQATFRDEIREMPVPRNASATDVKIETLTFQGCKDRSKERLRKAQEFDADLVAMSCTNLLSGDVSPATISAISGNREKADRFRRKSREAAAEVHLRMAQSAVAIPFVLLGCPVGILYRRKDFLHTFFVCFLPIITIYYPVMILSFNVVKEGVGPIVLSVWAPSVVMCLIAIPFLRRVVRY